jgi:hypothetical protein
MALSSILADETVKILQAGLYNNVTACSLEELKLISELSRDYVNGNRELFDNDPVAVDEVAKMVEKQVQFINRISSCNK